VPARTGPQNAVLGATRLNIFLDLGAVNLTVAALSAFVDVLGATRLNIFLDLGAVNLTVAALSAFVDVI